MSNYRENYGNTPSWDYSDTAWTTNGYTVKIVYCPELNTYLNSVICEKLCRKRKCVNKRSK